MNAGAGLEQGEQASVLNNIFKDLPASRVDVKSRVGMVVSPTHHPGDHHKVAKRGIDAASDDDLIHRDARHFPYGNHVAGGRRAGNERFQPGKIDGIVFIVRSPFVSGQSFPELSPALGL